MSTYSERLQALYQLEFFGMKLGLDNIRSLLSHLGHPERSYATIHIAGTNGKGSVAAMLAAIHQVSGKRVGLYTSPHLVDFRERIRLNGELIPESYVSNFIGEVWPKVEELRATFFEVTTALAFKYFADAGVDLAVIETGLGGRLDATNALERPLATVVTSIGFDHMAQLGNTLEAIAWEKAGIFKAGVPAIVNCAAELEPVFEQRAKEAGADLTFVRNVDLPDEWLDIESPLQGPHQRENLRTVLATLLQLPDQFPLETIREGIRRTPELSGIHARLETVELPGAAEKGVRFILDVGHNEPALERVKEYFEQEGVKPIVVFGLMRDKDIQAALRILSGFARKLIAVEAATKRALPSAELAKYAASLGIEVMDCGAPAAGVAFALSEAERGDWILLSGSHYVIGDFLENYKRLGEVIL